jgi:G3E family GTPase
VQEGTLVLSHSVLVLDASDFDNRMLLSQQFFVRQILSAPLFYLTKTERLTEPALETIRNRILALQPNGIFLQEPFADWEALSGRKPRTYSIPISSFSAASKSPSLRRY